MMPKGWLVKKVSEICKLQNGNSFKPNEWDTKGLPIIRIQNLNGNKNFNYFSGVVNERWLVNPGQLLFSWAGTKGVSFGPFIWKGPKGVLNQHIYKVFSNNGVDTNWLYYSLMNVTNNIESRAHGFKSTLLHVQKKDIDNQVIMLPPLMEQEKIAAIIMLWDKAISLTESLVINRITQKKYLIDKIFLENVAFSDLVKGGKRKSKLKSKLPPGWDFAKISDFCEKISTKNNSNENYPVLSCSKHEGFVDSLKYFNKKVYSDDVSGYRIVPRDAFAFPSNHIEEGSIGHQTLYDFGLVSPIYVVFRADESRVIGEYLYTLLKTERYRQIFSAATNASVDRRGSLRWKEFSSIHVPLPPLEHQKKVCSFLRLINMEIDILKKKTEYLKQEKKALMQQLLTGKRRVNTEVA